MIKRLLKWILIGALTTGLMGAIVSCKDYSSDIDNLQSQITSLKGDLSTLQSLINQGKVVTNVENTSEGIRITFSDSSTYDITNGKDGADGQNGSTPEITIGSDGHWYIDGQDTGVSAQGEKGDKGDIGEAGTSYVWTIGSDGLWYLNGDLYKGENGEYSDGLKAVAQDGQNGQNGADGKSCLLLPNYSTGFWELYEVTYDEASESDGETEDGGISVSYKLINGEFMPLAPENYGLTAIWDGNNLHLENVLIPIYDDGKIICYEYASRDIYLGSQLGSIAFVPKFIDNEIFYPTTDTDYTSFSTYYDEDDFDDATDVLNPQTGWSISSQVTLTYRLSPADAYIENTTAPLFLNRSVKTRAANAEGDDLELLKVVGDPSRNGEYYKVTTTLNSSAFETGDKVYNLVALRLYTGTGEDQVVTSDYIVVKSASDISAFIVDTRTTEAGQSEDEATKFYKRAKSVSENNSLGGETSDFISGIVTKNTEGSYSVNATFSYLDTFDLSTIVGLYTDQKQYFTELGLGEDVTYEYTIPAEFNLGEGEAAVNQQKYIDFTVSENNGGSEEGAEPAEALTSANSVIRAIGGTAAIGKTPVVRVDALVDGKLVASAYILLQIEKGEPLTDLTIEVGEPIKVKYRQIEGTKGTPDEQNYLTSLTEDYMVENIFSRIDGIETAADFWSTYTSGYTVTCYYATAETEDASGYAELTGDSIEAVYNTWGDAHGIEWYVAKSASDVDGDTGEPNPGEGTGGEQSGEEEHGTEQHAASDAEETVADGSFIRISVDNLLPTQHSTETSGSLQSAHVFGADGVKLMLKITFTSPDTNLYPNIVLSQVVYDVDECEDLELNPMYKVPNPHSLVDALSSDDEAVLVKGKLIDGVYKNVTDVSEHFAGTGNIFEEGATGNNVSSVVFTWHKDETGVSPEAGEEITSNSENKSRVGLSEAITDKYVAKQMSYNEVLANGEKCPWNYWIIFTNPFVAGENSTVYLVDSADETKADVNEHVTVNDDEKNLILSYGQTSDTDVEPVTYGYILSEYAKSHYGLKTETEGDVTVTYEIVDENGDWAYLQKNLNGSAYLTFYDKETEDQTSNKTYEAGTMVWSNGGTKLQYSYNIMVKVTVKLDTIGSVSMTTTVVLNDGYPERPKDASISPASVVL
ncbi:MAG: DUF4988 domain-containing protein [Bacteroidales bacterium]|nr:DUF4988 domain-containing protein [Bacteroidales bacterium]